MRWRDVGGRIVGTTWVRPKGERWGHGSDPHQLGDDGVGLLFQAQKPGRYVLEATHPDHCPSSVEVELVAGETTDVAFTLTPKG